jgi:hypothetical protein
MGGSTIREQSPALDAEAELADALNAGEPGSSKIVTLGLRLTSSNAFVGLPGATSRRSALDAHAMLAHPFRALGILARRTAEAERTYR